MKKKLASLDSELMQLMEYDIHITSKTMFIRSIYDDPDYGESGVDSYLSDRAIKNLSILDRINTDIPITIILNTPGGCWYHGMAIYDAIKECESPVHIIGRGQVMSMGSILMQAGSFRMMSKHAKMMIHDGTSGGYGESKNTIAWAEEEKKILKDMYNIFCERTKNLDRSKLPEVIRNRFIRFGWPLKGTGITWLEIEQLCTVDLILSAEDALALNLIDAIKS
jgi:ATP-dependent protease ClpP protease subunit